MAFLSGLTGGSEIGQALIRIGADTRALRTDLAKMNAETRAQLATTGQTVERQASHWGKAFTAVKFGVIGLGVGLAAFTLEGIKSAAAFDRAMAKVYALTGVSKDAMEGLRKQTLALAKEVPQAPDKLAEGLYYVISAGFDAADALKVLKVAAMDATVGLTDTQTVADGLTSAMNAYGYSADQAAHVSDIMTNAVTKGKMEWSQLASAIGTAAVQGATAGISLEEVTSAIATMTRSGLTASRSSMGVATLMRSLANPTAGARKEMKALGVSFDENTLKSKGLLGTLQLLSTAAGKHADVIVRDKKGNIDLAKSVDATAKANRGWAANLQAMTGNARGFLAAQIILQGNAAAFKEISASAKDASVGVGLSADAFEKMKEADPGLMFDLLLNSIKAQAIEFGTSLMPTLSKFVSWLSTAVPNAFATIGAVWDKYLAKPIGSLLDALGHLATAIGGLFGSDAQGDGDAMRTVLDGLASTLGTIVGLVTDAANFMAGLFGDPAVRGVMQLVGVLLILKATLGGILGLGGRLDQKFRGLARTLSGGLLFRNTPGAAAHSGDPALDASATKLNDAAVGHKEAAADLKAAAGAIRTGAGGAGFAEGVRPRGVSPINYAQDAIPTGRYGVPGFKVGTGTIFGGNGQLLAVGLADAEKQAYLSRKAVYDAAGKGIVRETVGRVAQGVTNGARTIKSVAGSALGAVSGVLGLASKAFWPIMVAGIATDLIKEPLGNFLASSTPWKRAAASVKDDFFGGLINMVKSWNLGSDLFVELPKLQLGQSTLTTENLGNFNLTEAQVAAIQQPGLPGALAQQGIAPDALDALKQKPGEMIRDWLTRIQTTLTENGVAPAEITRIFDSLTTGTGRYGTFKAVTPEARAAAQAAVEKMVTDLADKTSKGIETGIQQDVDNALMGMGFTIRQTSAIPPGIKDQLAVLLQNGMTAGYEDLLTYAATKAIKDAGAIKKNVTAADILKQRSALDSEVRGGLKPLTHDDAAAEAFRQSLTANVGPAQDAYRKWWMDVTSDQTGAKQALAKAGQSFIDQWGKQIEAAKTDKAKAALAKKIGVSWEQAQALLAESQAATGQTLLAALQKQLRATILQAAKDGSKEAAPEAAGIMFSNLTDKTLWGKLASTLDPKTIANAIANPNSKSAKELRKSFAAWFPKGSAAGTAKGFADAYQAWVAAGMLDPSKPSAMNSALSPLPQLADATTGAMDTLRDAAEAARIKLAGVAGALNGIAGITLPGAPPPPGQRDFNHDAPTSFTRTASNATPYTQTYVNTSRTRNYAAGGRSGDASRWVGEYGPEIAAGPGKNYTAYSKVQAMLASVAEKALGAARGGTTQQLYVDEMHLISAPDRLSILEAVEFLAPAGR